MVEFHWLAPEPQAKLYVQHLLVLLRRAMAHGSKAVDEPKVEGRISWSRVHNRCSSSLPNVERLLFLTKNFRKTSKAR